MRVSDLTPNPKNPRTITPAKLAMLKKAVERFGDLSGIVYNVKTERLVCGHQRVKLAKGELDVILEKTFHPKKTRTGTVAIGRVHIAGERFNYRAVDWDEATEKAAMVAANHNAGDDDLAALSEIVKELSELEIDLDLTMLDAKELSDLPDPIEVAAHTRERKSPVDKTPKCKAGEFYMLGDIRLRCGGDLLFCDDVLARWERHSGVPARLMDKVPVAANQPKKQSRTNEART